MKKIIILFIVISFSFLENTYSQDLGTLRGVVSDSTTSEALAFGNVIVLELNRGASTDSRGYFLIPQIPANKNLTLRVSYVGYLTKDISIRLTKGKVTQYNIALSPSTIQMQAVEKIGEKVIEKNETDISLQRMAIRQIEALPQGVETDVFRSLQYIPGVQSTGDVSARYFVRGGGSNQNLVLIDGITIYNPFHALGLFSVIDPDMINNIEFYKGGFAANFGGRLSSVLKISTNDGNKNKFGAKASSSFLTGKLLLEGPIPNGSFILTGRKSYSSSILKKFLNDQTVPIDFHDFSFKANYANPDFIPGSKFSFNGFFSGDNINNDDPFVEDFKWSNKVLGFKWFQVGDSPLFYEIGFSLSDFKGEVIPKLSNTRANKNEVTDVGINMDFTYMFDYKDEIGIGFNVQQIQTNLFIENGRGITTDLGKSAANISLYAKYKFLQFDFVGIDLGTRINMTTLSGNKEAATFEPRANITLNVFPGLKIKGAWGIFQQEMTTISDENEVINIFEPWIISPDYLVPSKSTHYILGAELSPWNFLMFSVEGYYKKVNDLPLLNDKKILSSDPDFIAGEGESYGAEFLLRLSSQFATFSSAYTNAFAYKTVDGLRYYPKYDVRHTLNFLLELNFGAGWSASASWIYNSGLPYTQVVGYYDKYYLDDIFLPPTMFDPRRPYAMLGIQNIGRMPDYHRLDLSVSKKLKLGFVNVEIDVSAINVYDRKNIFYFKRETGEIVNMLPFLPTATIKVEL